MTSAPEFSQLAADVSITAPTAWSTLLTHNVTTAAGAKILAIFSASGQRDAPGATTRNTHFRILLDGAVVEPGGASAGENLTPGRFAAGASAFMQGLAAGVHTVALQWNCDTGTSRLRPVTNPDSEHAALWTEEIASTPGHIPVEVDLAADKTANNDGVTFTNVVTANLTTLEANSQIQVNALVSFDKNTLPGALFVRIKVDGVVVLGASCSRATLYSGIIPIVAAATVVAGAHTIAVEFVSQNAGATINAISNPTLESCHLTVQEQPI